MGDLKFSIIYPLLTVAAGSRTWWPPLASRCTRAWEHQARSWDWPACISSCSPVQHIHVASSGSSRLIMRFASPTAFPHARVLAAADVAGLQRPAAGFLGSADSDGVAHWAHLGGFLTGAGIAIILLVSRLATARGGDLLSVVLGRYAWPLLGKPNAIWKRRSRRRRVARGEWWCRHGSGDLRKDVQHERTREARSLAQSTNYTVSGIIGAYADPGFRNRATEDITMPAAARSPSGCCRRCCTTGRESARPPATPPIAQ